ncbi:MAG: nucleoside monophosphate kinase [Christensenellaceae bacterium]|jgi:adenylate kinase|nr:nucleoside monophosphate kinase [Christensenellaceae bacterium]
MNIILNAPSGGGKGSVAEKLVKDYNLCHISTGALFRENIKNKTPLGIKAESYVAKGVWVPDELTVDMLVAAMKDLPCAGGFILDGFPRTLKQAELLEKYVDVSMVIQLDVADDIVMKRLAGRFMCRHCGAIYNSNWDDVSGCCKACGGELYQREDDKTDVIKQRISNYNRDNGAILEFYKNKNLLHTVKVKEEYLPADTYAFVKEIIEKEGKK